MEFFDSRGINVDKNLERKIENLFFREDFRRTPMDRSGKLDFPSRMLEAYTSGFLEALAPKAISGAGLRVVIDYAFGNASLILPRILSNLGVEMIALNAYFDDTKVRTVRADRERHLEQLGNVTTSLRANLGILLDQHGETLVLVDDRGRTIEGPQLFALITLLVAQRVARRAHRGAGDGAGRHRGIAAENGATIVRTRSDRRSLMALAEREAATARLRRRRGLRGDLPRVPAGLRPLYAAAKVMELLAAQGRASQRTRRPASRLAPGIAPRSLSVGPQGTDHARLHDETHGENVELSTASASDATAAGSRAPRRVRPDV